MAYSHEFQQQEESLKFFSTAKMVNEEAVDSLMRSARRSAMEWQFILYNDETDPNRIFLLFHCKWSTRHQRMYLPTV